MKDVEDMSVSNLFNRAIENIEASIPVMENATNVISSLMKLAEDQMKTIEELAARNVNLIIERDEWKGRALYAESINRGTQKVN